MQTYEHTRENDFIIQGEILDKFYAPVQYDALTHLASEFTALKARVIEVHSLITEEKVSGVLGYFFEGNGTDQYGNGALLRHTSAFNEIFDLDGALNELTAQSWNKALNLTNLMDVMPQKRRSEWGEMLRAWKTRGYKRGAKPELDMLEFNLDNLRATISGLMARRSEFLAERVDGIFMALSRTHITNSPEGFGKRMIMSRAYSDYGSTCHEREGYIHDLRIVISKFMGRDEPCRNSTSKLMQLARHNRGKWIEADGGSFRIRGYQIGTAHLEVHPDMAWRLNAILSYLHPAAIPESFKKRPARAKASGFRSKALFERPLSNAVCSLLCEMEQHSFYEKSNDIRREYNKIPVKNALALPMMRRDVGKHLLAEVNGVMTALGAVLTHDEKRVHLSYWQFDYEAREIIAEVAAQGYLPDQKAHNYYPTPETVAAELVEIADIQLGETFLEPSAGQGGIAVHLPRDRTLCVEISPLHCAILRAKGYQAIEADFLSWEPGVKFDVVLMNPPFSDGRWIQHIQKGATHVAPRGRLVAVLPMSAKSKLDELLPGFDVTVVGQVDNAFAGTSISVVLIRAVKR